MTKMVWRVTASVDSGRPTAQPHKARVMRCTAEHCFRSRVYRASLLSGDSLLGPAACRAFFMSFDGTRLQTAGFISDQRQQLVPSAKTNPARVAGFFVLELIGQHGSDGGPEPKESRAA